MEQITLGQIGLAVTFIVGLLGGIGYLKTHLQDWIRESLKDDFRAMEDKICAVQNRLDDVDMGAVKNYLVSTLAIVEKGGWLDEIEKERFYEQYEHYSKIGGNSYIQRKVEELKKDGKI